MIKIRLGILKFKLGRYLSFLRIGEIKFDIVIVFRLLKK